MVVAVCMHITLDGYEVMYARVYMCVCFVLFFSQYTEQIKQIYPFYTGKFNAEAHTKDEHGLNKK